MSIKAGYILAGFFCFAMGVSLWAQQKKPAHTESKATEKSAEKDKLPKKKAFKPGVYLGREGFAGGPIKAAHFDSLLKQGLFCHDSAGNYFTIVSFNFNYAERRLYEDSAGDMHLMMDNSSETCLGDTISSDISSDIYERIKHGDTVVFNQVIVTRKNATHATDTFLAGTLKCEIAK